MVAEDNGVNLSVAREHAAPLLLLVFAFVLVMVDGYDIFIVSFLVPLITAELNLTHMSVGQIFAAGLTGSMLGGMVLGPLADRFGRRPVLTLSLAIAGVATILCSTASSFGALAAYRLIAGFALGGVLAAVIPLVAVAAVPWPLGYFDAVYGVTSLILGGGMLALAVNVYRRRQGSEALRATRKLFAFSILYLFTLFATLLVEVVAHAIAPSVW